MLHLPLALFALLVVIPSVSAQQHITAQDLDLPWARLNLAETQTGILANRRSFLLDPTDYDGSASADTLAPGEWEILYGQIRMSAADPTILPGPATLAASALAAIQGGRLPIALLYQPYDFVDSLDF